MGKILEWLLYWFPIVKDFLKSIESFVLLIGLFWLVHRLKRERLKMKSLIDDLSLKIGNLGEQSKAAQVAAESALGRAAIGNGGHGQAEIANNWEVVRSAWQEARDRMELAIDGIGHKSVRAKYSKMPRYNYRDIITSLHGDGVVRSNAAWLALQNMNTHFHRLRIRPGAVTNHDAQQFKTWLDDAGIDLPERETLPEPPVPD